MYFSYFTFPGDDQSLEEEEKVMMSEKGKHCMAHQGWIMGGDVLADFAAPWVLQVPETGGSLLGR